MNILFCEVKKTQEEYIRWKFNDKKHRLYFLDKSLSTKNAKKFSDIDVLVCFIYTKINSELIGTLPNLKLVATMSTGFDHIDLKTTKEKSIAVSNVPYYGENTVAEHTFSLILALSRKLYPSILRTKQEGSFSFRGLEGFDLKGKTLGIAGCGHIGAHVARMAKGLEMKVLVYDLKKDLSLERKLKFKYVSLKILLKNSDIVTLHVPYNKATHHLINSNKLKLMKKGSYIVNTARGALIDTKALLDALNSNHLSGAALDVLEEECNVKEEAQFLSSDHPNECLKIALENVALIHHPKVIVTPHNAFNSKEALERIIDTTVDNIKNFIANKPKNIIKT